MFIIVLLATVYSIMTRNNRRRGAQQRSALIVDLTGDADTHSMRSGASKAHPKRDDQKIMQGRVNKTGLDTMHRNKTSQWVGHFKVLESKARALSDRVKQLETETTNLQNQGLELEGKNSHMSCQLKRANQENSNKTTNIRSLQLEKSELLRQVTAWQANATQLKDKYEAQRISEVSQQRAFVARHEEALNKAQAANTSLGQRLEILQNQSQAHQQATQLAKQELQAAQQVRQAVEQAAHQKELELREMTTRNDELRSDMSKFQRPAQDVSDDVLRDGMEQLASRAQTWAAKHLKKVPTGNAMC